LKSVEFVKVALKRNGFVSSFVIAAKRWEYPITVLPSLAYRYSALLDEKFIVVLRYATSLVCSRW
jgi:hypothetical protein